MLCVMLILLILDAAEAQCEQAAAKVEFALSENPALRVEWTDGSGQWWNADDPDLYALKNLIDPKTPNPPFPSGQVRIFNAGFVDSPYHPQDGQRFDIIVATPASEEMTRYSGPTENSAPFFTPIVYNYPIGGVVGEEDETWGNPFLISDLGYLCLGYGLQVRFHSRTLQTAHSCTRTKVGRTTHLHVSTDAVHVRCYIFAAFILQGLPGWHDVRISRPSSDL